MTQGPFSGSPVGAGAHRPAASSGVSDAIPRVVSESLTARKRSLSDTGVATASAT